MGKVLGVAESTTQLEIGFVPVSHVDSIGEEFGPNQLSCSLGMVFTQHFPFQHLP
jgi:hypothetical protein